jgi:predicted RNA-binding protein YlxR (DUF448 family)
VRDDSAHGTGRGVYACMSSSCIEAVMNRGRFERFSRSLAKKDKKPVEMEKGARAEGDRRRSGRYRG